MKRAAFYILVLFYFLSGVNHFWHPYFYLTIIPPYLPHPRFINGLAGVIEIALATLICFSASRHLAVYLLIAMLIAFIPSHIYFIQKESTTTMLMIGWVRLLIIQPLLLWWVWWVRGVT